MLCYIAGRIWVLIRQFLNCMGYARCECTWVVLDILLDGGTPFSRQSLLKVVLLAFCRAMYALLLQFRCSLCLCVLCAPQQLRGPLTHQLSATAAHQHANASCV
jgi:hypothetical protein